TFYTNNELISGILETQLSLSRCYTSREIMNISSCICKSYSPSTMVFIFKTPGFHFQNPRFLFCFYFLNPSAPKYSAEQKLYRKFTGVVCCCLPEEKVAVARSNLDKLVSEREQTAEKLSVEEQKIKEISKQRGETKNVLEFIHGGENGALLGAWDFVSAEAPKAMMENLIDDGAPETSQLSMSIGSVTFWNLGERKQVFSLCQSWACNEVNQAATYPSPYANVHKGNMCSMGGSIGQSDVDLWKPYTMTELHSKKSFAEEEIGLSKDAASDNMTAMLETSRFASSDNLSNSNETEGEKLRRLALGKIVHVNVTVWTVAYALPYHAKQLYEKTHILNPNANSVPCLCTVCDKRFLL
ncbi:Hypothetical predicted protein, partial [Paramuricea clavata]